MTGQEMDGVWEERFEIRSYDVDIARRLTVESLLKYFQEAAWNHAERLGRGYLHLRSQNLVWVLSRMMVLLETHPVWGQPVILRTWPCGSKSLFALRDFEVLDETKRRLAVATSSWLVLDLESRRPQRIEPVVSSVRSFPEYRAAGDEAPRLGSSAELASPTVLKVNYSDLDLNDHVNNATYARWVFDSYEIDFHRLHRVRSVVMNFLAEVGSEDSVTLGRHEMDSSRVAHTIRRRIDNTEACRVELVWESSRLL